MGAYLSQPKTDKESSDEFNEFMLVGASSMQGWRNSQEDAHNAILNFDNNTAFFAVYDGHGGAEVSTYCADKLPNFLKSLDKYKTGNFEQALKDAFLGFDETLLQPEVIDILKALASDKNVLECDDSDVLDDDEDENLVELHEEGKLPLDEVMEKYVGHPSMPSLMKLKESQSGNGSKPQSPYLRGRRAAAVFADAANRAVLDPESKPEGSSTSKAALAALQANDDGPSSSKSSLTNKVETEEDSTVSSSSSSASKTSSSSLGNAAAATAEVASSSKATNGKSNVTSTDTSSTSTTPKENEQNGSVSSSEAKPEKLSAAASSSSPSKEDATVSGSNDSGGNEVKQNGNVESSTVWPRKMETSNASAITSTSKDKEKSENNVAEDSNDDDDAEDNVSNVRLALEFSSDEDDEEDEEMGDEEDADYDDDDDEEAEEEDDEEADEDSYLANEQFYANMIEEPGKDSGCTAVVALLSGRDLFVANAGDSRCVVCRNGKAIEMSLDHKPEDEEESMRIVNAGGRVTLDGRVNGGLNLSRALGDHAYKMNYELRQEQQMISAMPDIRKLIITPEDEFMILACDGIWNFMSSEEVVDFVRLRLKDEKKKMSEICEELFDACLAPNTMGDGTGCDNMTAVIVKFKPSILNLETKIDANETEDVLLAKKASQEEDSETSEQRAQKRSASPSVEEKNVSEAENKTKRLKTDTVIEKVNKEDKDQPDVASSSSLGTDIANEISTSKSEQKECDSGAASSDDTKEVESSFIVVSST